jgi:hypothetical protein
LLLEEVTAEHEPLDPSVLRQVVANCQMESDMFIHHSSGLEETCHYLKLMLEYLEYRMTVCTLLSYCSLVVCGDIMVIGHAAGVLSS